jgi:hypothetical protein
VAAIIGLGFGTLFQATHSVQGPKLGIPQMIQSRAQFGYYGAIWPQLMAWLEFVGFTVFNVIVGGQALHISTGLNYRLSLVVIFVLAVGFASLGYHYIHVLARWATWAWLVVFGFLTIGVLFAVHLPAGALTGGGFKLAPFLFMFGVTASYQVTGPPSSRTIRAICARAPAPRSASDGPTWAAGWGRSGRSPSGPSFTQRSPRATRSTWSGSGATSGLRGRAGGAGSAECEEISPGVVR